MSDLAEREEIQQEILDENVFEQLQAESQSDPRTPETLRLLPLRDIVLFPVLNAPIAVGRERYIKLIDDAATHSAERVVGIVTQKDRELEHPGPGDIYSTGVAVTIRLMGKRHDATHLFVQGIQRFTILQVLEEEPYLRAKVKLVDEAAQAAEADALDIEALRRQLISLWTKIVELSPEMPEEFKNVEQEMRPWVLTDLMAAHSRLGTEDKMAVLETLDLKARMTKLLSLLTREAQVLELGASLHNQAAGEINRHQREYFLREQMKAIQRELGEGDDRSQDLDELKARLDEANLPEEARKEADRELERLGRMAPGSPEYTVARTYVDLMASLPWSKVSEDRLDIPEVKHVLDEDHYGLEKIKDRILEYLSVRKFKAEGATRQPILCFVGPPGVGKTSLARSIARALGKEFYRLALGGVRDEAEVRGHRRTYIGAMPGQILQGLKRAGTANPVFVLDEIDKVSSDFRGDPSSALLEVLDPEQNVAFRDNYLDTPFDLSRVLFITTANQLDTIQSALRDRMEIIELSGYTEEEKAAIARQHLVPKQLGEHGLTSEQLAFTEDGLAALIRGYTREAGVRSLERQIAAVARKATRQFAEGRTEPLIADLEVVTGLLGAPRFEFEELKERPGVPGVVNGLVWTPVGGDTIAIESIRLESGKGELQLTGQLGDVMQESAKIALSWVKAHLGPLGIAPDKLTEGGIHIHVPAGATPKDGPSAGVTMVTALVSLLTDRPVRERLAMTGEVTLTGRVLPVGGIKEKVLAARRAGVTTVLLPERNRKDLEEDIPAEFRAGMTFYFVRDVSEVLPLALEPTRKARKIRVAETDPAVRAVPVEPAHPSGPPSLFAGESKDCVRAS
jgi:ATP-dependent Lon protease